MATMIGPKKAVSGVEVIPAMTRPAGHEEQTDPHDEPGAHLERHHRCDGRKDGGHDGEGQGMDAGRQGRIALDELEVLGDRGR